MLALCLCIGNLFAQDGNKLKDEGYAALIAKDYATALAKYSEYLKLNNYQDTFHIFYCGYLSNRTENYAEAVKYFDMCVKLDYNVEDSFWGKAKAYDNLNKTTEFLATVEEGLKVITDDQLKRPLEKLLYGHCMKVGLASMKAGKLDDAEKMFTEILIVSDMTYKANAYFCLGSIFYGNGAMKLKKITPLATSAPNQYNAEKTKADADLKKAKEYLTKALEINLYQASSKALLNVINAHLK